MITIGSTYFYEGKEVTVTDGCHLDHTWTVVVKATGQVLYGIMSSQLKRHK